MPAFLFNNGDRVRNQVDGQTGVVMARIEFIDGTKAYMVQPAVLGNNTPIANSILGESLLELVAPNAVVLKRTADIPVVRRRGVSRK